MVCLHRNIRKKRHAQLETYKAERDISYTNNSYGADTYEWQVQIFAGINVEGSLDSGWGTEEVRQTEPRRKSIRTGHIL